MAIASTGHSTVGVLVWAISNGARAGFITVLIHPSIPAALKPTVDGKASRQEESKIKDQFKNASRAFKKLNPGLRLLGCVEANRAEPTQVRALEQALQKPAGGPCSLEVRITLIAYRRRLLDAHDAVAYACKPLTDAIAETMGIDDADPRLSWHYEQHRSLGIEGVIVEIETLRQAENEH